MTKIEFAVGEFTFEITFGETFDILEVFDKDHTRVQVDSDFCTVNLEDVVEEYRREDADTGKSPQEWGPGLYQHKGDETDFIMVGGGLAIWFDTTDDEPEAAANNWSRREFIKVDLSEFF